MPQITAQGQTFGCKKLIGKIKLGDRCHPIGLSATFV